MKLKTFYEHCRAEARTYTPDVLSNVLKAQFDDSQPLLDHDKTELVPDRMANPHWFKGILSTKGFHTLVAFCMVTTLLLSAIYVLYTDPDAPIVTLETQIEPGAPSSTSIIREETDRIYWNATSEQAQTKIAIPDGFTRKLVSEEEFYQYLDKKKLPAGSPTGWYETNSDRPGVMFVNFEGDVWDYSSMTYLFRPIHAGEDNRDSLMLVISKDRLPYVCALYFHDEMTESRINDMPVTLGYTELDLGNQGKSMIYEALLMHNGNGYRILAESGETSKEQFLDSLTFLIEHYVK